MTVQVIQLNRVQQKILIIRGQRVMLDMDLAELYGVSTKRLNEQVKRNRDRFPEDFMFRLTAKEKAGVVANCDHLAKLKFSPVAPSAFSEYGAIMAANILNSKRAIEMSLLVVRAFVWYGLSPRLRSPKGGSGFARQGGRIRSKLNRRRAGGSR